MVAPDGLPNGAAGPQIAVKLHTRQKKHEIPDSKFFVPSDWKRYQLSELINKVLGYEKPVPFDFLVQEELLRTSLAAHVKSKGLTEESVVELEYVESIMPPEYMSAFEHDDWVADVDLSHAGIFLSACYDGNVHVFSSSGQRQATIAGHTQPVLSTCWLNGESVASAGMDRVIRVSRLQTPKEGDKMSAGTSSSSHVYSLPLHSQPVASVRSSPLPSVAPRLLSSGWDGLIALWSIGDGQAGHTAENDERLQNGSRKKRRKVAGDADDVPRLAPLHILRGHVGQVSRACFDRSEARTAYSCGWDHSVRSWDLEVGGQSSARTAADKVLLDIDQMASANLLVTGSTDRTVCFWDTRQDSSTISLTLQGHTAPVSCVRAHPSSAVLALSTGYDGMTRIWDARSPKQALFAVRRSWKAEVGPLDNKVLCADWDASGSLFATGGQDGRLEVHRASARLAS